MSFMKDLPARAATASVLLVSAFVRALGMRACRYSPTCSEYAAGAFRATGFFAACRLTASRVLRCHPFAAGGYDPVAVPEGR
jgi:putative membrane protein insertion efficiency factor